MALVPLTGPRCLPRVRGVRRVAAWQRSHGCERWCWTAPIPRALAEFYRQLVGGEITYADDDWVNLRDGAEVLLSFQRSPDYEAPIWPDGAGRGQQFHIDVTVYSIRRQPRRHRQTAPRPAS